MAAPLSADKRSTTVLPPTRFTPQGGRFVASVDMRRGHASSMLNQKAYKNAIIARDNGKLGSNTLILTNGGTLFFSVATLAEGRLVHEWLQLFESNWGNSNL
jgi:hypothetical protein